MDNFRLILIMALFFILLLMYQAWQQDYGPKSSTATPPKTHSSSPSPATSETATPSTTTAGPSELPSTLEKTNPASGVIEAPLSYQKVLSIATPLQVETDVFKLELDTYGGDIRRIDLVAYPLKVETPTQSFRLLNDELPNLFVAQSGLLPADNAPTHQTVYQSEQTHYRLTDQADSLEVKLYWQNDKGLKVTKIYTFHRHSYIIDLKYLVTNASTQPWQGQVYGQFQRSETDLGQSRFVSTYTGGAISSPSKRYEKITFKHIREDSLMKENRPGWANGWIAMIQHYFVGAWVPEPEQVYNYYTKALDGSRYVLGLYGPPQTVAPGTQHSFSLKFYAGPKSQHVLSALSPGLDLTVDYGWLWFIAQPLFWLLEAIHGLVKNWGWSIIILTIIIKLAFFHLSATSYKSMANMRRLHPRLVSLKERYGEDKARLNQAMMELYKKEKINPLGGCLPILIQIPVFISLYWVLLESVELRQASFIWWWQDLSTPDPYFVLPLVMGVTMLIQHHLNPAPIDPVQQKVMMILPIVFTVFFAFFPSGLVLYWLVNNVLSITQQWVITKKIAGGV